MVPFSKSQPTNGGCVSVRKFNGTPSFGDDAEEASRKILRWPKAATWAGARGIAELHH